MTLRVLGSVALLSGMVLAGCAGMPGVKGAKSNLADARKLNAVTEEGFNLTMGTFDSIDGKVDSIPEAEGVDKAKLDLQKLKKAMVAAYSAPVDKAKASKKAAMRLSLQKSEKAAQGSLDEALAAPTEAEQAFEDYLKTAAPETADFARSKLQLVRDLRDELTGVLPAQAEAVLKQAGESKAKLAAYVKAQEAVVKLPTAGAKAKDELKALQAEQAKGDELFEKIDTAFKTFPERLATSGKNAAVKMESFGK